MGEHWHVGRIHQIKALIEKESEREEEGGGREEKEKERNAISEKKFKKVFSSKR